MPRAILLLAIVLLASPALAEPPGKIAVAKDGNGFIIENTGAKFTPWGFNYDRDFKSRLIEEYWETEWPTVEKHFAQMKQLGANVVRVHLQFGKFMDSPDKANEAQLARLVKLVDLAEKTGLYLDLTGLGCYRRKEVPAWFDQMDEKEHWAAQAKFWSAIAKACTNRPGVFCYDLVNEPVVATQKEKQWVHPAELGGFCYVQFVNRDLNKRVRTEVARDWIRQMTPAIRAHDQRTPITVGIACIPFGPPEEATGFVPAKVAPDLDFISIHFYPQKGKVDEAIAMVKRCNVGKPLVIEEMFPMNCSIEELKEYIQRSRGIAHGWVGFYWGQTPDELKDSKNLGDVLTYQWLKLFEAMRPAE